MMMKIGKMRDDKKYIGRGIVNILVGIVVSFLLSAVSLYFATDKYGIEMFQSYFENGYIVFLNTLPVFFSIMFVFLICNELWIGISITSILVIVLSLINYFKLLFRDDPLLVEDLTLFSEMKNMTGRYKIHINRDMILWILGMTVVIFVVWKLRKIIKIEMQIRTRIISVIMIVLCGISCMNQFILNDEYYQKTENIALINRWGGTQQFISRGFIYPFLYSSKDVGMKKPDGYNKKEIENSLKDIKEDDIPEDKKVNIIAIMMEAYGDFSVYPQIEFDQQKIKNQNNQNRQQDEPDGSCLLEVFAEGFPVGTEDIRLLIFDHLQRDVVHCCEIGADCHNRDTHNKENNVQHHQVEDTAHNLRELTVQAEKTHNLFLFSVELSVPPINVPAGRHHRKV